MAVVINEFDVVPATSQEAPPATPQTAGAPRSAAPSSVAELERALIVRAERRERLAAS